MLPEQAMSAALGDPAITADDLSRIVATGKDSFRLPDGSEYKVDAPAKNPEADSVPPPKEVLLCAFSVLTAALRI